MNIEIWPRYRKGERIGFSLTVGWNQMSIGNRFFMLSDSEVKEILGAINFKEQNNFIGRGPRKEKINYFSLDGTLDNLSEFASKVHKKPFEQMLYPLNGRYQKDRNGFYVIPTSHYKRPPRLRFHESLKEVIEIASSKGVERPVTRLVRRCKSCGAEGTSKDMWGWGFVAGVSNSDYICKCNSCGDMVDNSGVKELFRPFGSNGGTLEIEEFYDGRPMLALNYN